MNKVTLIGRLTREPEVRQAGETTVARYSLAVDRRFKKDGEQTADFINCVTFGKSAEFVEKYLHKGTKIAVNGRIQTGSYEKDGVRHYTTDVIVEEHEFCESKAAASSGSQQGAGATDDDGFMTIPDGIGDELPFA